MAKLRHIALATDNVPQTVEFYQSVFGMKRVNDVPIAGVVYLSDGVVNLAIIDNVAVRNPGIKGFVGLHHMGFVVDDVSDASANTGDHGGSAVAGGDQAALQANLVEVRERTGLNTRQAMRKVKDPNGIEVDILDAEHARLTYHIEG